MPRHRPAIFRDREQVPDEAPSRQFMGRILHAGIFALGLTVFLKLTHGLLRGRITYSVGEVDDIAVTTSGFWETLSIYLTFGPIAAGLMILGAAPRMYVKYPWLLKALLATCALAYVWNGVVWHKAG